MKEKNYSITTLFLRVIFREQKYFLQTLLTNQGTSVYQN